MKPIIIKMKAKLDFKYSSHNNSLWEFRGIIPQFLKIRGFQIIAYIKQYKITER